MSPNDRRTRGVPQPPPQTDEADCAIRIEACSKRVRAIAADIVVFDTRAALLLVGGDRPPTYYIPRGDVRMDLLRSSRGRARCRQNGVASHWRLVLTDRTIADAAWSYVVPPPGALQIATLLGFKWEAFDYWLEEDEEILGSPRDPRHRIDVRASSRSVHVGFAGERIATTRQALFLFETDMPARHYIPLADIRDDLLVPSQTTSICPYKGLASYWSIHVGDRIAKDAVWTYAEPLPDAPPIRGYFCFDDAAVDAIEIAEPSAIAGHPTSDDLAATEEALRAADA